MQTVFHPALTTPKAPHLFEDIPPENITVPLKLAVLA